jgi:POT family proton-dependent oligopeptide transporter
MTTGTDLDVVEPTGDNVGTLDDGTHKDQNLAREALQTSAHVVEKEGGASSPTSGNILRGPNGEEYPTEQELQTLRRIRGSISWIIYTIAFCELCERFAYYGTTAVCK